MTFTHQRVIYLGDTDAAGVMYFAKLLEICHEAYENWLIQTGINFRDLVSNSVVAIPIVHAEIDFLRPVYCSDELLIEITTAQTSPESFTVSYSIFKTQELVGKAMTKHVAINPVTRRRNPLPSKIVECFNSKT